MARVNPPVAGWRKGRACLPSECVEVAAAGGYVLIRDSADKADGPVLVFSRDRWQAFTEGLGSTEVRPGGRDENLIPGCPVHGAGRLNYSGSTARGSDEVVTRCDE
jgi:hypothetical protein